MKNLKLISNEKLIELLTEASSKYYNTDIKTMSDEDFDKLELEYQRRFNKKFIGSLPLEGKGTINVKHSYSNLVGTLSKCKNIDSFMEWFENSIFKINSNYEYKEYGYFPELYLTLKYDGNSVVIEFDNGKVKKALTRGKDGKGLDLTHVFKDIKLNTINEKCGIKYEVIMTYENFNKLMKKEGISYANPRSVVAGKLGCDDAYKYLEYFTLIPLWIKFENRDIKREEEIEILNKEYGDFYEEFVLSYNESILRTKEEIKYIKEDLEKYYKTIQEKREKLPFMIDGIVIEFVDNNIRKELGMNTGFPNWATALKFPYMEKTSKVIGFDYCLGDSSRITPRVYFEPVSFNGTVHQKQSLQNYKRFKELNLSIGSDILVQYSNDCLSYIERLDTENNRKLDKKKKKEIIKCPECGTIAQPNENETFLFCPNENCPGKIVGKIQNYLTKMDIKGIKENMIIAFKNAGLLNKIEDLYTMDYNKIKDIDRMGSKVALNVKNAINNKIPYDYEILGSLGIENCSITTSKDICKIYSLKELIEKFEDDKISSNEYIAMLTDIEGISYITASYILNGLKNNINTINFLLNRKYIIYKDSLKNNENSEIFVFTGFRDKDLQSKLELMGHKVTGSVSNKTTVVVTKDPNSNSSKIKKAKELNIKIITPEECKKQYIK